MPTFHHLYHHIKQYGNRHRFLYLISISIFFLMVFDGIVAYLIPILITERGFSLSEMGLIVGSSSIVGAIVDVLLSRIVTQVRFRLFFFIAFIVASLYSLAAYHAQTVGLFLLAMALWGVYWDLYMFGSFDFVGRHTKENEHSSSFGVMQVFIALSGLVAPLIAARTLEQNYQFPFFAAWIALACAAVVFIIVVLAMRGCEPVVPEPPKEKKRFLTEMHLWKKLGSLLHAPIILVFSLHSMNGLFWTLAPLYPFISADGEGKNAALLIAYSLPALLAGWVIGSFTGRYGKKRVAFGSFFFGSLILTVATLFSQPFFLIAGIFAASFFLSMAFPAISGAYADYISEAPEEEEEIEGIQDFSANLGYVIGPISAGLLSDRIGIPLTFTFFGLYGVIVGLFLLAKARKKITITNS